MLVKVPSAVGIAMIWLATVAGVSASAWVAIDRAGRDLSAESVSALTTPLLGSTVATTSGSGPIRTHATPGHSESTTTATTTGSTTSSPSGTSQTSPLSPPTPHDRTVMVTGGQVSVRCTGADLTLRIAQPDDGWKVDVERAGAGSVDVKFQRGDEEQGGRTHVKAVCSAGTPVFTVATRG